jgi:hypothetical protein
VLKKAPLFIGFCLFIGIWGPAVHAQTINAASCNVSDVQRALSSVNQATATVVIPAGTCSWTSAVSYTVPSSVTSLTIQGQTTVNCTGTAGTSDYTCAAADSTIIQDNFATAGTPVMKITIGAAGSSSVFRFTGITLEGGSSGAVKYGTVWFFGSGQLRLDHDDFNMTTYGSSGANSSAIRLYGSVTGVADHNLVQLGNTVSNGIQVFTNMFDSVGYGDGTWDAATQFGTANFFFMENNQFNGGYDNDCIQGGRFVMRYNTMNNASSVNEPVQSHGTSGGGAGERSCRAFEVYHNYITSASLGYTVVSSKGGTSLVWGNTVASRTFDYLFVGTVDRSIGDYASLSANPPNGWGWCGTDYNGTGSAWDGNQPATTGFPCLDGIGRGATTQSLNGQPFPKRLNSVTGTVAWPKQYDEPAYMFDNTLPSGMSGEATTQDHVTAANRDYYFDCGSYNSSCSSGFTGAAGTGTGTLASRPSTCTAGAGGIYATSPTGSYGVAYWATDQNTLYVCTSTNTWTAVYSPYTYPHPLVSGGTTETSGNVPNSPTNLSATVQ